MLKLMKYNRNKSSIPQALVLSVVLGSLVMTTVGCSDGPIRKLFRGGACNTCQPPNAHPSYNYGADIQGQPQFHQPGFDGFSSSSQAFDHSSSYYPSNLGNATINPTWGGAYVNGSLDGSIVPPNNTGF